ncbi:MAG: T9SS type A sorting domain-containing protein, partial [Bacteroidota bacterium]
TLAQSGNTVLPVELTDFRAYQRDYRVVLTWETAGEINNHFFTVERSTDARMWQKVTRVEGAGTVQAPRQYESQDPAPPVGTIYYRLRQTNLDGSSTLSQVRKVHWVEPEVLPITVYPNPVSNYLTVEGSPVVLASVDVFTVSGYRITNTIPRQLPREDQLILDLSGLPKGTYIVTAGEEAKKIFKE